MELKRLEIEIKRLQVRLYNIGEGMDQYSSGEILRLSEELDKKIILYQKLQYGINN